MNDDLLEQQYNIYEFILNIKISCLSTSIYFFSDSLKLMYCIIEKLLRIVVL